MDAAFLALLVIVAVALAFDYTNGFHDAANAIAVAVSTKALTPRVALALAAVMNLVGALISTKVAATVGSGIIEPPTGSDGLQVVFAALVGAITWNLITWYFGLPSSSSHALIGGLVGAALAAQESVQWSGILDKVVIPMVLSPLIGFGLGYLFMLAILWTFRHRNAHRTERGFRHAQILSSASMAFGHGTQDAQKTMGIITLALVTSGHLSSFDVPFWVILASALAISAGTYSGGFRLIRTLGGRVLQLRPPREPAAAGRAVRRPEGRVRRHDRPGDRVRGAGVDDAHHDHVDHGRGRHPPVLRGALGRGRQHRHRLGAHPAGGGSGRRARLLPDARPARLRER